LIISSRCENGGQTQAFDVFTIEREMSHQKKSSRSRGRARQHARRVCYPEWCRPCLAGESSDF